MADSPQPFIVVGIDGSEESKEALRWAGRQATLTGSELRVIISWHLSSLAYGSGMPFPGDLDFEANSKEVLERTIKEVFGDAPPFKLTTHVIQGYPAPVLLAAARGGELLVLGSRGHGAFTGMLLGSVSEHCVTHASCPVVVVRNPA